jgi:hypothetical protein
MSSMSLSMSAVDASIYVPSESCSDAIECSERVNEAS